VAVAYKYVIPPRLPVEELLLITQMRAGTHFFCSALRVALEATVYRPDHDRQYVVMEDDYILKGLHEESRLQLPPANPMRRIYFNHYYHPQFHNLPEMPRIYLIGFPLDSFYSDGVVANHPSYDPGPSGPRAGDYILRFGSQEWKFLFGRMRENAAWLMEIEESHTAMILRYEDLCVEFETWAERVELFVGGFVNPPPKPVLNRQRTYWTQDYRSRFDGAALKSLWALFAPSIERFYPERMASLHASL
jgi:hypothetical protein